MDKHLLVTVSEQQSTLYGVRFAGNLFSNREGVKFTLFYAVPRGPQVWTGEKDYESVNEAEIQAKKNENRGRKALRAAQQELMKMGFEEEQIKTKLQHRRFSKAVDIIQEGAEGLYDAVVLGRRGLSRLEEAFDESVSKEVLEEKSNFPIWICRKPDLERKGVLVCIDGSDASERILDHVGFILAGEEEQEVTLLSVNNSRKRSKKETEAILLTAGDSLVKNGLPSEMIKTLVIEDTNVARAILTEAENGLYSAVASGRTGAGQGLLGKIFMGSVSTRLFRELEGAALWLCY
jgi:nucleotide-binding universal stress UspA family protein